MTPPTRSRLLSRTQRRSPKGAPVDPEEAYARALALAKKGRQKHAAEVIPLLRAAAEAGHPMASHALASWYIHGVGVRRNYKAAVALEQVAARSGIAEAVFNLAYSHESGKGVRRSLAKAFQLYHRAAVLGDAGAMYELGRCLFYGIGTPKNERLAHRWIERAEQHGHKEKAVAKARPVRRKRR